MKRFGPHVANITAVLLVLSLLRPSYSHTPAGVFIALLFGAAARYIVKVADERANAAAWHKIAVGLALLLVMPIFYTPLLIFTPPAARSVPNAKAREQWAAAKGTLSDLQGMGLASTVSGCLQYASIFNGPCVSLKRTWYATGQDSIAAAGGYGSDDDGWRWDFVVGESQAVLVFPDPILRNQPGPVFEVRPHEVLRREKPGAPAYYTNASLANMVKALECVARRAEKLKADGTWDGKGTTLPLVLPGEDQPGCVNVRVEDRPANDLSYWNLQFFGGSVGNDRRVIYRPVPNGRVMAYEMRFFDGGMGYLVDDAGNWHMRPGNAPGESDPPPPPCVLDPKIPCS